MSSLRDRLRAKNKKRKQRIEEESPKKSKLVNKVKKKTEPKTEFKAGKAAKASKTINCISCMHWKACSSKRKRHDYACTRFKGYPEKKGSAAAGPTIIFKGKGVDLDEGLTKEERVISELISRTIKGSGVIAADSRIDDRDIPTAPNFYTWITDPKFMGNTQVAWAKQIEHPTKLYVEWCPNRKCTDLNWWENVPVDATPGDFPERVTFLEWGVCPRCHTPKSEWIRQGKLKPYNALAGLAGQRSAKTATAVMGIGYDKHRQLKSQNPSAMYGVMTSQVLTGTFAALTFEQAKDNIWSLMFNMLHDAAWFQQYHAMLKDQCYRLGIEDVFSITPTYARYRHRNLFYHVSGPNKRTMRGKTRITAMIDEIGWFLMTLKNAKAGGSDPERLDAKGTHEALDRSLLTVRSAAQQLLMSGGNENVPMGYLYETSSPSSKADMIMQRYAASRGSRTIYGYRMATWEANPTITRETEDIVEAYRTDPIAAERDYAANPPVSGHPYVKLPSLRNLFAKKRENAGLLKTVRVTNSAGQSQTSGRIKKLKAHRGEASVLSLDAGSVNNSFAFSVLYANEQSGRIICPFIGEIFPSHEAPVHFPDVTTEVIGQLVEHYNVGLIIADRWQSLMLLQQVAEEHEIAWVSRSLNYADFDTFRQTAIYDGALLVPMLENKPRQAIKMANNPGYPQVFNGQPLSHLLYQLVAVNDLPNVGVTKPEGGTDDLFRSLVLGYTAITDPEYAEFFESSHVTQPALGIMMSGAGMSSGASLSNKVGVAVGPRNSVTGAGKATMGVVM